MLRNDAMTSAFTTDPARLAGLLARHWWVLALRGVAAIVFGLLAWFQPGLTIAVLILLFGGYAIVDGVLGIITALAGRRHNDHWLWLLLWGLSSVAIGIVTFVAPGVTAMVLLMFIAIWAIITGVAQIVTAIRLRREMRGEWLLGLAGAASVLFGVVLIATPGAGALAMLWLIALYAILFGALLLWLSFRVRSLGRAAVGSETDQAGKSV